MKLYNYQLLPTGPYNIRLLQILPGEEGTDIFCQIVNHTIRHNRAVGPYEALSYVWGDPNNRRRIYITESVRSDSKATYYLEVTKNLYAALQRLRDPDYTRVIWIDAVG